MRPRLRQPGAVVAATIALMAVATPAAQAVTTAATVLRGVVTAPDGVALPGATVTLTAIRPMDGDGLEVGFTYSDAPVATTTSGPDGTYAFVLTRLPDLAGAAALNNGVVNFWVQAFKSAVQDNADVTVPPLGDPSASTPPNGTVYSAVDMVYLAVDSTGLVEKVTGDAGEVLGLADVVALEMEANAAVGAATQTGVSDDTCSPNGMSQTTVIDKEAAFEPVAQVHTGWDTTLDIDYGHHANTDLAGAAKVGAGPWKVTAGMSHMGNKSSTIVGATYGAYRGLSVMTKFNFVRERFERRNSASSPPCFTEERIRPEGWAKHSWNEGMDRYLESTWDNLIKAKENRPSTLGEFSAGTRYTKKSGRGRKYSVEVKAFGIGLKAQSSFSAQIDVFYKFGPGTERMHWIYHPTRALDEAPALYAW